MNIIRYLNVYSYTALHFLPKFYKAGGIVELLRRTPCHVTVALRLVFYSVVKINILFTSSVDT